MDRQYSEDHVLQHSIFTGKLLWSPPAERDVPTAIDRFRRLVNAKFSMNLETYDELYRWSVGNYADFWGEYFTFADIIHSQPFTEVVDPKQSIETVPRWFAGCRLNFAENMLRYDDDRIAVHAFKEGLKDERRMTFSQLRHRVLRYQTALRAAGVRVGDRVVGYIPNCPEALEACLAAASLGAIWSCTSPDFGVSGVLDRFSQITPKVIFSVDAVIYNGKTHDHIEKLTQVVKGLPGLERVVVIPYCDSTELDISEISHSMTLDEFLASAEPAADAHLEFEQVPFDHPLYIMYSSGTTGAPKCMVHSVGGTLIQHLKEHVLHGNTTRDDVLFYFTTTGWMMWNWYVTALAVGAAVVMYDGSPMVPHTDIMWDLVDRVGVTILGTSAKWISVMEARGSRPADTHSLRSLHTVLSTGSPLKPLSFEFVYRDVKRDVLLGSITGGTDIISCFAGQNVTLPVYSGELQARNLGMAVECCDETGTPLTGKAVVGTPGELICTAPFPSMPTHFWNDPDGVKYRKAYFSRFPGVWHHGDYCALNGATGGLVMLGRSDGVLNPSGVRFGSAEIYNIVESFKEIADSVCVAQRSKLEQDERVVLFLKMGNGTDFSSSLVARLRSAIRQQLSARHVPAVILPINDIPYTISGKKVEVAVRKTIAGETVDNLSALANPEALTCYDSIPELADF